MLAKYPDGKPYAYKNLEITANLFSTYDFRFGKAESIQKFTVRTNADGNFNVLVDVPEKIEQITLTVILISASLFKFRHNLN